MSNPHKIGHLTLIGESGGRASGGTLCVFECDCGATVLKTLGNVKNVENAGYVNHCGHGCPLRERPVIHGMTQTRPHAIWKNMLERTRNPKSSYWKNYGGRGITVCDEWATSFEQFWADMGAAYGEGLTLDRIDNSEGYSKGNCKWSTTREQSRNRRSNVLINTPWGRITVMEASEKAGLNYSTLMSRVKNGVPEENLLDPVGAVKYKINQ